MSDVNANIKVSIDSSQALSELKSLQRQISLFHSNIAKSSAQAALAQKTLQTDLLNAINATGRFSAEMRTIKTSTEAFTNSLEKNKFSIRQYFRYAGASTKTFGKLFRSEFDTISQVAEDRVKKMQTQYIKMGRDAKGAMQAIAITPKSLNLSDMQTQLQITAQKQQLFNQLLKQGSTNLLNFGKNTQWAGRQLMVGFTLPLAALGATASKTFMQMETAAIKFRKVYGDLFTPTAERDQALQDIQELGGIFTKYGIAVSDTVNLAADAAAAGFQGLDLQRQVTEATRLQVLGQVDQQKALETTISLQNAFKLSNEDLSDSINFLNAVENQTVTSLDDITTAIPKVAPVIMQLGGNVKDLAFFLTAMKEGGVNASEGANALKSGLASLINPSDKASAMLERMGINITKIVEANKGDLKNTVIDFAKALDNLDPLTRARAIEQLFGKFQFARLSTLFDNVITSGNQASRVLDLANASAADLAKTAESELGMTAESSMTKFRKALEDLKVAIIPIGQTFLEAITPILETIGGILEKFKDMSSGAKRAIILLVTVIGGLGPILLMTFGLLANGLANILSLFGKLRAGYLKLGSQSNILGQQTQYLTSEEIDAAAVASSLDQAHSRLIQTFNVEAEALNRLRMAYANTMSVAQRFAMNNPGMMFNQKPQKYANGGEVFMVPGSGNGDTVPAMLTPGEIVVPKEQSQKYYGLLKGIIANKIPGFQNGRIPIFPEYAMRLQNKFENMRQQAGTTNVPSVLANLAMRVGEARGIVPSQSRVGRGAFDPIVKEYEQITEKFVAKLNQDFEETFKDIKDSNERFARSWMSAGKSVEEEVNKISMEAERGAVRKVFGLDPDVYGTIPTAPRRPGGAVPERGRRSAFLGGTRSYTSIRGGVKSLYQRMTGLSAAELQMGHVFKPQMIDIKTLESDPRASSAVRTASKVMSRQGAQVANEAINATARAAQTASPSKRTISIGEDIARGLEVGMKNRQDDVEMAGSTLSRAAVSGAQSERATRSRITTYGTTGPVDPISKSIRRQNEKRLSEIQASIARPASFITQNAGRSVTDSLTKMNSTLRTASFGLMSVGAAGSFAGGKVGEMSQQIMKYSGLLFGLMTITELLTQQSTLQFLANRRKYASEAVAAAVGRGGIAASAGPFAAIAKFGSYLKGFLGPIGLTITAFTATYKVVDFFRDRAEDARKKLEAFSEVLKTTEKEIEFLTSYFNFVPIKGSLEDFGEALEATSTAIRSERDKIRGSKEFQSAYGDTITGVRNLSDSKARSALLFKGFELMSKGMSKESVQNLIDAIKEEAGKTTLSIDFKDITLDASGFETVNKELEIAIEDFNKTYKAGIRKVKESQQDPRTGKFNIVEVFKLDNRAKAALKDASNAIALYSESLNRLVKSSKIDLETFNTTIGRMFSTLASSVSDTTTEITLLHAVMQAIDPDLAKTTEKIEDQKNMQLLLKAAIAGVSDELIIASAMAFRTAEQLNKVAEQNLKNFGIRDLTAADAELRARSKDAEKNAQEKLNEAIKDAFKIQEELNKLRKNGGLDGTGENALKDLIKKTEELERQTEVYKELRKRGIEAAIAQEMAANVDLAKLLQETGYVGNKWKSALKAIKEYAAAQKELEKTEAVGGGAGDYQRYLFDRAEKFIALQEQLIDMQYKGQIKAIDDQLETLNDQLDTVKEQEDAINKKFDTQVKALTTIKNLNDAIAAQEKQRLTIADALSRGDISAAAVAMQEARAQQASASMEAAQQGLTAGRESAIAALGRENIQKQIDALNKQKDVIEKTIEKQKESITYFGMTAEQIRDAARALDLAKDAGMNINNPTFLNNLLKGATGDASALKLVMVSLQEEARKLFEELQNLRMTFLTKGGGAGGVGIGPGTLGGGTGTTGAAAAYGYTNIAAYQDYRRGERMYGGFVKKYAAGGIVAGRGMIDSVPSLLTPGEFVVNRNASKRFAPLLQSINESKYPNSLALGGASPMIAGINNKSVNNNNTSVYNYSLSVNAGSSASPDDIARVVMTQIKNIDAQRVRGSRY